MSDKISTRLNVLYIISILKKYSSPKRPLSIAEITDYFTKDINEGLIPADKSTISRILEDLCSVPALGFNTGMRGDFYEDIHKLGFDIHCVISDSNSDTGYRDYRYPTQEASDFSECNEQLPSQNIRKKKSATKYFYYDSVITDAEISLLIDAIETYNYFDGEDIVGICNKLRNLHPQAFQKSKHASDKAEKDSPLFQHIDILHRIIKAKQFAEITYCTNNYKQELVARNGYPRIIRPLKMLWSNGYYYLVCIFKKRESEDSALPINLRIDRIIEIKEIETTPGLLADYPVSDSLRQDLTDTVSYRLKHPVMHAGPMTTVKLLYLDTQNGVMNNLIRDTFGTPKHIRRATQQDLENNLPPGILAEALKTQSQTAPGSDQWVLITLETTTGGVELFAMQHCNYCKVTFPHTLADKITEKLTSGLALYQRKP